MARAIIKIKDKYFIWSTMTDSPIIYGATEEQILNFFIKEAVEEARIAFDNQMKRVKEIGHGYRGFIMNESVEKIVSCNKLGENGTSLSVDEIYEIYGNEPDEKG